MRDIYLDESSTSGQKWMVLGCLIVPTEKVSELVTSIRTVTHQHQTFGELKWTKVSRAKAALYFDVVNVVFDAIDAGDVQFHSLVIDTHQVNHGRFNNGSKEIGYNKFAYQLLSKAASRNSSFAPFYVYMDDRNNALGLTELRATLNNTYSRDECPGARPFHRVVFRDSKTTSVLQACDLLTGAIAFQRNGYDKLQSAAPFKCALAMEIARRGRRKDLTGDTPFAWNGFRIWTLRLQK